VNRLLLAAVLLSAAASCPARAEKPDAAPPAPAWLKLADQGTLNPALKGYVLPEGVKVEVVAEAPVVANPVALAFADDGTPYVIERRPSPGDEGQEVVETVTYKDGSTRLVALPRKRVKDVVKTLHDSKGKGVYDEAKVVLEDDLPAGILPHDGWLYVAGRGAVRRYKQSRPGGPWDVAEVVARGFGGFGRRQVSGMVVGPDGWLYLSVGGGDNVVEGSDGSRAAVLRGGAVFRCRPDGSKMETFALGLVNPYGDVAFDEAGNLFLADEGADGPFAGVRLLHAAEGNDFGWRLRPGARGDTDPVRAADRPGRVPAVLRTSGQSTAGLLVYNDTRFPDPYRGLLFSADPSRGLIRAYRVERVGATFVVTEEFDFMKSGDPLFRPCRMAVGPDGALYVVDSRTDFGDRLWGDGKQGRIYRLTWSGTKEQPALERRGMDSWAKVVKLEDADLVKALSGDEATDREAARRELVRRGPKNNQALRKLLADDEQPLAARVAALGVLQAHWDEKTRYVCEQLLALDTADVRRLCADALGRNAGPDDRSAGAALLKALGDEDPSVRRSVALALGRLRTPGAADALANALAFEDGKDVNLRDGLVRAVEGLGAPGIERLLALADSGVPKDLDRVVEAVAGMRTRPAADALPALLKNPHQTIEQRALLVRSFSNYLLDPPVSVAPVLDHVTANPTEAGAVKVAALETLSWGDGLKGDKARDWLLAVLDDREANVRLAAIRAVADVRLDAARPKLEAVAADGARTPKEREAAARALRRLDGQSTWWHP
jgi:quinoprotein glucose dehydrogenase